MDLLGSSWIYFDRKLLDQKRLFLYHHLDSLCFLNTKTVQKAQRGQGLVMCLPKSICRVGSAESRAEEMRRWSKCVLEKLTVHDIQVISGGISITNSTWISWISWISWIHLWTSSLWVCSNRTTSPGRTAPDGPWESQWRICLVIRIQNTHRVAA